MRLFVSLAIAQLLFIIVTLSLPIQSHPVSAMRHVAKTVLGASVIADDSSTDTPTDTPPPSSDSSNISNDQPTDIPTPSTDSSIQQQETPTDTPTPTVPDTTGQNSSANAADQVSPTPDSQSGQRDTGSEQTSAPDSNDQSLLQDTMQTEMQQDVTPTEVQTNEANLTPIPTDQQTNIVNDTPTPNDSANQDIATDKNQPLDLTSNSTNNAVVLDPQNVITNTSSINDAIVNEVANQDVAVNNKQSPEQKINTLQTFVKDNVININNQITQSNFSSTALLSQQLNKQLDTLSNNLAAIPTQSRGQISSSIQTLCDKANIALRTEAMVVPEDLEQDIITNEAKCYNLSL